MIKFYVYNGFRWPQLQTGDRAEVEDGFGVLQEGLWTYPKRSRRIGFGHINQKSRKDEKHHNLLFEISGGGGCVFLLKYERWSHSDWRQIPSEKGV